jgi:hypothetical protein
MSRQEEIRSIRIRRLFLPSPFVPLWGSKPNLPFTVSPTSPDGFGSMPNLSSFNSARGAQTKCCPISCVPFCWLFYTYITFILTRSD